MKMSRACSGMLSSKNEDFQILKNCQKHKMHVHHVHHSSMVRVTVLSLQNQLVVGQKHERNSSQRAISYFSEISKFRYW